MFITFDYKCPTCGNLESRFVRKDEMDDQECDHLGLPSRYEPTPMTRLPAGTRTTFRYADQNLKD